MSLVLSGDQPIQVATRKCETRVLIVDDDYDAAQEIRELLTLDNFMHCEIANDAIQAMGVFESDQDISIVITDLRMPGLDGLQLIQKLRNKYDGSRDFSSIVVTGGHTAASDAIKALQLGTIDIINKPISPDHLLHTVGKASEKLQLGKLSIQFRELLEYQVEQRTQDVQLLSDDLLRSKEKIQSLKRQLLASNKIKSEFLDMINHELRTPLTPILGFAELIAQTSEEKGNMEEYRYSKIISSAGSKLLNIIDTMLELVDADNGNLELNIVEVSMLDIVGRVIDALSSSAESSSINLTTSIIKNPIPMVQGDSTRLIQAIYNIVNNSIRHCPPGTNVIVAVRGLGKELTISVSDDGGGMNEVELKAARQSFGQVDGGHTRTVGGIGLGLTLANILIELHGGRMTISSQKGLGTKVEMIIPRTGVYDRCFPSQLKRKMT